MGRRPWNRAFAVAERLMKSPSPMMARFRAAHPRAVLHPELERIVRILEIHCADFSQDYGADKPGDPVWSKVLSICRHPELFEGLSRLEANRDRHFLMLHTMRGHGVQAHAIRGVDDPLRRPLCAEMDGMRFEIGPEVDQTIVEVETGVLLPDEPFPPLDAVSNMPSHLKKRHLMDRGRHMPPFRESCRCQVLPALFAH